MKHFTFFVVLLLTTIARAEDPSPVGNRARSQARGLKIGGTIALIASGAAATAAIVGLSTLTEGICTGGCADRQSASLVTAAALAPVAISSAAFGALLLGNAGMIERGHSVARRRRATGIALVIFGTLTAAAIPALGAGLGFESSNFGQVVSIAAVPATALLSTGIALWATAHRFE